MNRVRNPSSACSNKYTGWDKHTWTTWHTTTMQRISDTDKTESPFEKKYCKMIIPHTNVNTCTRLHGSIKIPIKHYSKRRQLTRISVCPKAPTITILYSNSRCLQKIPISLSNDPSNRQQATLNYLTVEDNYLGLTSIESGSFILSHYLDVDYVIREALNGCHWDACCLGSIRYKKDIMVLL